MKLYIGNCSTLINWNLVIDQIKQHDVPPFHSNMDLQPGDLFYEDHLHQKKLIIESGYAAGDSLEYRHYNAGTHFDQAVETKFGEFVNATPLMTWISEVRPGKCVPWHWDINPWQHEWEKKGKLVRFFCFITPPQPGHVFMVEKECFYYESQGSVYQYPALDTWHAGSNAGYTSKYLFTFTGYQ